LDEKCLIFGFILLLSGCVGTKTPQILSTLSHHNQVLIVNPIHKRSSYGFISAWENAGSCWKKVYMARAVLGRNGLAPLNAKQEGDGKTPSGVYSLANAFGYAATIVTKLNYRKITDQDFWVDDVHSVQYNQWIHGKPQAKSFEHMYRNDKLYRLGVVIEYNTQPIVSGKGSAIFLHIWRTYYKPTSGCVALSERNIRKILTWLDKSKTPVIVLEGI